MASFSPCRGEAIFLLALLLMPRRRRVAPIRAGRLRTAYAEAADAGCARPLEMLGDVSYHLFQHPITCFLGIHGIRKVFGS